MGANGTFSVGIDIPEEEREYKTIFEIEENVKILQYKDGKQVKLPEESHTPGRIYAVFRKGGKGVKEIAGYGDDHKRAWVIHTTDHDGLGPHIHQWKDGTPIEGSARSLNDAERQLLERILNLRK